MNINTLFNEGDLVFFLYDNKITYEKVKRVTFDGKNILYFFQFNRHPKVISVEVKEADVFKTTDDLTEKLVSNFNENI